MEHNHEKQTKWVVFLTAVTMVVEIIYGISSHSMALLADGIHMGSHVGALGLSWVAYVLVRKHANNPDFTRGTGKILALSGYTSGLILLIFAILIIVQAIERFIFPQDITYNEAILVAIIGFIVNIVSAFILHHDHSHSDHNIKAAYLHVLADAITSLTAIAGLLCAKHLGFIWFDTIGGLIGAGVIIKWSIGLLKKAGLELIDYSPQNQ